MSSSGSGIERRTFLTRWLLSAGLGAGAWASGPFAPSPAAAQPAAGDTAEPTPAERTAMGASARAFMQSYAVPGFSVAVGRAGAPPSGRPTATRTSR